MYGWLDGIKNKIPLIDRLMLNPNVWTSLFALIIENYLMAARIILVVFELRILLKKKAVTMVLGN